MTELTEKQFNKAVGKIKTDDPLVQRFLKDHPLEMTDEWIYEWKKYWSQMNIIGGYNPLANNCWNACFCSESEGFYGQAMYMMDHAEDWEEHWDYEE